METTPPTPQSDATKGFTLLMGNISSIIELLRTFNKRPLPATEDQVKGLVKLAERDRPLEVKVKTEEVVAQLVGQVEQLNKQHVATMKQVSEGFAKSGRLIGEMVDNQTAILKGGLELGVKDVQAATADMKAVAGLIPSKMPVDFKQGWRWVAGLLLGPVVFVLLGMGLAGQFSKVSKSDFEQLQKKWEEAKVTNAQVLKEGSYYKNQIKNYKAKNPNKTTDFPVYKVAK